MSKTKSNPIRCFEGNAKPHEPFWKIVNSDDGESEAEIWFDGIISEYSWMGDEITPKLFHDDLERLGGAPVTVRLNSPGGDVIAASLIRSMMTDYPGHITVRIDGIAASAAVIVAMAGSTVKIMDSAYMMIHDPEVVVLMAQLDIETLKSLAERLSSIKSGIVDVYSEKTGISVARISKMMAEETWMSAKEAVNMGFANEMIEGGQRLKLEQTAYVNALRNYVNVPQELVSREPDPEVDKEPREAERLREYVQIWKKEK